MPWLPRFATGWREGRDYGLTAAGGDDMDSTEIPVYGRQENCAVRAKQAKMADSDSVNIFANPQMEELTEYYPPGNFLQFGVARGCFVKR